MSKLPSENQFLDLSDYGRPIARIIAQKLKNTTVTPVGVTIAFIISGLTGILFIILDVPLLAAFFLILKSILDAADGELARVKQTPSYTGRYLDSISDIILNFFLLLTIGILSDTSIILIVLAFFCMQLQGTLYNYYYVILRSKVGGDQTSRIFEIDTPVAMSGESQANVNFLFGLYRFLYGIFDKIIYTLDRSAADGNSLPKWLMTGVSIYGLGFQLLIIAVMLLIERRDLIIPFYIYYTILVFVFIVIRKSINQKKIPN